MSTGTARDSHRRRDRGPSGRVGAVRYLDHSPAALPRQRPRASEWGVISSIQGDVFLVGAGAAILNRKLNAIAKVLPALAEKAESLPAKHAQAQTSQQPHAQAAGTGWRPATR